MAPKTRSSATATASTTAAAAPAAPASQPGKHVTVLRYSIRLQSSAPVATDPATESDQESPKSKAKKARNANYKDSRAEQTDKLKKIYRETGADVMPTAKAGEDAKGVRQAQVSLDFIREKKRLANEQERILNLVFEETGAFGNDLAEKGQHAIGFIKQTKDDNGKLVEQNDKLTEQNEELKEEIEALKKGEYMAKGPRQWLIALSRRSTWRN